MTNLLFLTALLLPKQDEPKLQEGVYSLCEEVAGYSGETVELKDGRFRYWFYSDVVLDDEPTYPLLGAYTVKAGKLALDHPKIFRRERTIAKVNGVDVLWRSDGLALWEKEKRIHPYAVLLRMPGMTDGSKVGGRPSLELLKSEETKERERKAYESRFEDQPSQVRAILRARTVKGDSQMDAYRGEVGKARLQPDPKLVLQLVSLMHRDSPLRTEANSILEDLYLESWLFKEKPAFLQDEVSRTRGLTALVDSVSGARDRHALEETVLIYLQATGVRKIELAVDGTGVRVSLEAKEDGSKSYRSETPADDIFWLKAMPKLIPACQAWMKARLAK